MNPLNHVSERWFWRALVALMVLWVGYLLATDPGPRPTERVGNPEPVPGAAEK